MPKDLYSRYVWLIDTIKRYGKISRKELDECWLRSSLSDGAPLPRRTFYNYRIAIESLFKLNIVYDPRTTKYSIADADNKGNSMSDWILNSTAITNLISDSRDVSDFIFLEDVPSAREFLSVIINALKEKHPVSFDYHPYSRTSPKTGISVRPYFLKIFRQRWYMTGFNVKEKAIKTYALDRMSEVRLETSTYKIPESFDPAAYFNDSFGIVFNHGEVKNVVLKVESRQAKYFRALPLHHSQQESVGDEYSLFSYKLKISDDFVQELLSHGDKVTVIKPPELRAILINRLKEALKNYE